MVIFALCMLSPLLLEYALYGTRQNGHTILRYPHSTQVMSTANTGTYHVAIIGTNDCNPKYKLVAIPGGRFGATGKYLLSEADIKEWQEALAVK